MPAPVLLPYQSAWIKDEAPIAVYEKSRRIGISWATAGQAVLETAAADGQPAWYVGYNQEMAREFIKDCADWAEACQVACGAIGEVLYQDEGDDILSYRIKMTSGHEITALSSRPSNLRGKQGLVIIDEAAFHPDLPGLLKSAIATLMWGGKLRIISTHNGDDHPFNQLVNDIRAGRLSYSLHRTTLDDALEQGLYKRICLRLQQRWSKKAETTWREQLLAHYRDDAQEELFCIPAAGGGTYIPRHLIDRCMQPGLSVLRIARPDGFAMLAPREREGDIDGWLADEVFPILATLPKNRRHFFGQDFGRTKDLSVIAVGTEQQDLCLHCPLVLELRNIPFDQQRQILYWLADRLPRFTHGAIDAGGNGAYLAEVAAQRYYGKIEQVKFSEPWYREHMPHFKARFEDGTITIPQDADILADLRAFKLLKGVGRLPEQRQQGQDGGQRHGDAGIALALLDFASGLDEGGTIAYHAVKGEQRHDRYAAFAAQTPKPERRKRLDYARY